MGEIKYYSQKLIAEPLCVVKPTTGLLIVPKVGEGPGLGVKRVRPVRIVHAGCQNNHAKVVKRAPVSESSAVADPEERSKWIVPSVPDATTTIDGVNAQIR